MIFITGGECSGKRAFAKSLGYEDKDIADACINDSPVIANVDKMVFQNPDSADALLPLLLTKEAVICSEVGSGIIPVSRKERDAREACGRLSCALAKEAEKVYRLVSGIPVRIK